MLEIEGEPGSTATAPIGTVDEVVTLGTTDAAGRFLVNLASNALENGTLSLLVVQDFTGALNADLDTNDDGTFDVTPWTSLVDGVAVNDGTVGDRTYATTLGVAYDGQPFAPGGASRIPDGTDTDTTADWVRNDFDLAGIPGFTGTPVRGEAYNTPGAANAVVAARLAISDVASAEGASGTTTFQFTVSLGVAAGQARHVRHRDRGRTATAPSDYTAKSLTGADDPGRQLDVHLRRPRQRRRDRRAGRDVPRQRHQRHGRAGRRTPRAGHDLERRRRDQLRSTTSRARARRRPPARSPIDGIVVGDYQTQGSGQLRGFFVQEEDADADADPATSEGIFVFCATCPTAVAVGDRVRVIGPSSEFFDDEPADRLDGAASVTVLSTGNALPTPAAVDLPVPGVVSGRPRGRHRRDQRLLRAVRGDARHVPRHPVRERVLRAGSVRAGDPQPRAGGRTPSPPHHAPTAAGFIANEIDLARRSVILDDTDNRAEPPGRRPEHRLLPPGPRPQHLERVPRRGHDHEPHRRPPLVVRRRQPARTRGGSAR